MNVIKQERFLYDEVWTESVDKCFISLLVDARAHGLFNFGEPNTVTIEFCTNFLNMEMHTYFTVIDCLNKLAFLQLRYRVFRWLLCKREVHHLGDTNQMRATQRVWNEIIEIEPFAMAYQEYGDPNWIELQTIFRGLYNQSTSHNPMENHHVEGEYNYVTGNINNVNGPADAAVIDINVDSNSVNTSRRSFSFPSTFQGSNNNNF